MFPRSLSEIKQSWLFTAALIAFAGVLVAFSLYLTGVVTVERHKGFYASIWDTAATNIYFVERDTTGLIIGPGWEHFTPPAQTYIFKDRLRLRRLHVSTGVTDTLEEWNETPVQGRLTKHYRSRIFNYLNVEIERDGSGVNYALQMNIPVVPRSEINGLAGSWPRMAPEKSRWTRDLDVRAGISDDALTAGQELIQVPGPEGYPSAVLSVNEEGAYSVVMRAPAFNEQYEDGIPPRIISERSRRPAISWYREIEGVRKRVLEEFEDQGLSENEASLRTADRMEALGYYPKTPRLIATVVSTVPSGDPVFPITNDEFRFGMFSDIERAIRSPGAEIKKSMGQYIRHHDFTTSQRLNDWLDADHDQFIVENDGKVYSLRIVRE